MCPVCNSGEETTLHILVDCEFAAQIWRRRGRVVDSGDYVCFADWLRQMFNIAGKEECEEIVTTCWGIWKARNELVWDQKRAIVNNVVGSTKQYLTDWKSAQGNATQALYQVVEQGDGAQYWVKPLNDEVKITVDAAKFSESSSYGAGMLVRNGAGAVLFGKSVLFKGNVSPGFAEAMAVKEALSWCKLNKEAKVTIESDCLSVVQAIRSDTILLSTFGEVIAECRKMLKDLNIALFFIKRSANMAAHFIARESRSFPDRVFDGGSVPVNLISILLDDLSH